MDKKCFVVCPISSDDSPVRKRSDQLLQHIIKPVCESHGYTVIRADVLMQSDRIDSTIIEQLKTSDLVITDVTDHNPNVFYELGYRSALSKPTIQLAEENTPLPFDVASIRTIFYHLNDLDKVEEVKSKLGSTIKSIDAMSSNSLDMKNTGEDTFNDQLIETLSLLLMRIQSSIDGLYDAIKDQNNVLIKEIMSASFSEIRKTPTESNPMDKAMGEMISNFFLAALDDPQKAKNFVQVIESLPSPSTSK